MSRLAEIFEYKQAEVAAAKAARPLEEVRSAAAMRPPALDLRRALLTASRPALIAEVKQASPSRGQLAGTEGFDPVAIASTYARNGAAAISVLTDEKFFKGSLRHLEAVRAALPSTPLLRKDFTCDPYQVYEARASGADAILLIVAALKEDELVRLQALARDLGMAAVVEAHSADELETALRTGSELIGINNRNLHDFAVRLETTLELAGRVPPDVCLIAESGILTAADIERVSEGRGVEAVLVGEALMRAGDVAAKVRELSGTRL